MIADTATGKLEAMVVYAFRSIDKALATNRLYLLALEQGTLILPLFFATQLLFPGASAVFQLLANRGCGWEVFRERRMQFSQRVADSAANAKMRLDRLILTNNSLTTEFAIGLCNPKEVGC